MSSPDIPSLLYSVIDRIGREKIRAEVRSELGSSRRYIEEIIAACIAQAGNLDDKSTVSLCEALLHFMLTSSGLPSERKVSVGGKQLDIIIPSLRLLKKSHAKSIVIQLAGNIEEADQKIAQASILQPEHQNIWLVSAKGLTKEVKNYCVTKGQGFDYSTILLDIDDFLRDNNVRSLPFLHG